MGAADALTIAVMTRLLIAIAAIALLGHAGPARAQAAFQAVDVYRVVGEIRAAEGHPVVVLLYGAECPLSKAMFPGFVQAAREFEPRGVRFLVFNTDGVEYGDYSVDFLRRHQAGFPPMVVRDWAPGELSRAMKPLGIAVGKSWTRPLVAVFDRKGSVIFQSQGETDLRPLRSALAKAAR
jgi:hypothetical protein